MAAALELTTDELLTTTRSVRRRLDLDRPVPVEVIRECVEIAEQAPSGSNRQTWHFVVVTDPKLIRSLAELTYRGQIVRRERRAREGLSTEPSVSSVAGDPHYLERVPALLIGCIEGRIENRPYPTTCAWFGSIIPALWSFCLAARSRGLGTCWSCSYLAYEDEAAALLGIDHTRYSQVAMLSVGYTIGTDFHPAARRPVEESFHLNGW